MNVLLANVFTKFRTRIVQQNLAVVDKQKEMLSAYFDRFDIDKSGYLEMSELVYFFEDLFHMRCSEVHDDYKVMVKVIHQMSVEDPNKITKDELFGFFIYNDGYAKFREIKAKLASKKLELRKIASRYRSRTMYNSSE